MLGGSPVFEQEGDLEVAEISGLAMIKTLEVFQFQNPGNKIYTLLLSKAYGTYAFGFVENRMIQYKKDPEKFKIYFDRAKEFYRRGKAFGMMALKQRDGSLVKALDKGVDATRKRMEHYSASEIDPIFWTAFSWGGLINCSKDDILAVADLAIVEIMMGRVLKVAPTFYFGAPHLFYAVYYASRPPMLGGDPVKAKEHFDEAAKINHDKALMVYALEAQYLAPQTLNKNLFREMLAKVNDGAVDAVPEERLANALAKQRGKFLQQNEASYF